MQRRSVPMGVSLLVVWAGAAWAASFDCKLAKTPQEKAICGSPKLSATDEQLSATYKTALAATPAEFQGELRGGEATWLRSTASLCHAAGAQPLQKIADCMEGKFNERISFLKSAVTKKGGMTFVSRTVTLTARDSPDFKAPEGEEANPGMGTLNVSYPQAASKDPQWVAWNAAVVRAAQAFAGEGGDSAKKQGRGWVPEMAADLDGDLTVTVDYASDKMVSVSLEEDIVGHGAAHPSEAGQEFHWLLNQGRELRVADVFKPGSGWKQVLSNRCMAGLRKQDAQMYDADMVRKALAETIGSPKNWQMDGKGLTVVFPEYSVAPRAFPVEPVTVPWSALQADLQAAFAVPR